MSLLKLYFLRDVATPQLASNKQRFNKGKDNILKIKHEGNTSLL